MRFLFFFIIMSLTGCTLDPDLFTDIIKEKEIIELRTSPTIKNYSSKNTDNNENYFIWPVKGEIVSMFGPLSDGVHNDGVNIKAEFGSSVNPTFNGEVIYLAENLRDFGKLILISHPNGYVSSYAHLSKIHVIKGAFVSKNDVIGEIGESGIVKFPQLYFEIRNEDQPVNPEKLIK